MSFTADDLLTSIKRGITVPSYQVRFTDADILALADEEVQTSLVPLITGMREEFFVKVTSLACIADQREYAIPYRAVGRTIRDLKYNDGTTKVSLRSITEEDEEFYTNVNATGKPFGFCFQEDKICLIPPPNSTTGSIECKYELRPNKLTVLANVGTITAINTTTGVVTVSSTVPNLTTSTPIDFIQAKAGNVTLGFDVSPTNVSSTLITFTPTDLPADLVVGDYVAFAGYTPVVQLPEEAHPVLANAVHCRILRALGDYEGLQVEQAMLAEKKQFLRDVLAPRIEGRPPVVINRRGLIRRRGINRRFV